MPRHLRNHTPIKSSLMTVAAAVVLAAIATTPVFAQALVDAPPVGLSSRDHALYLKNLQDSGYNPKDDYNPNGTLRGAIQEPGLFSFYYPNLDVLNGGAPTPAARMSPNWPALKGACAAIGGGITYCGDRSNSFAFAPDASPRHHVRRHHRS